MGLVNGVWVDETKLKLGPDPKFLTKRGLNTRYAFSCGHVETKDGLTLHMEHGVYHVRGFRQGKMDGDKEEHEYHIMGSFAHVKEARKFMSHPFTHEPSMDGSVSVTKVAVG